MFLTLKNFNVSSGVAVGTSSMYIHNTRMENPYSMSAIERLINMFTARLKTLLLVEKVKIVMMLMAIIHAASTQNILDQMWSSFLSETRFPFSMF